VNVPYLESYEKRWIVVSVFVGRSGTFWNDFCDISRVLLSKQKVQFWSLSHGKKNRYAVFLRRCFEFTSSYRFFIRAGGAISPLKAGNSQGLVGKRFMTNSESVLLENKGLSSRRLSFGELPRFLVVGGVAFCFDFLSMALLTEVLGVNYLIANAVGFCVGLNVNYFLSILWVFKHRAFRSLRAEFILFAGIGAFNLGLGEILLWILVDTLGLHYLFGKIVITGFVFLSNYILRKTILFYERAT